MNQYIYILLYIYIYIDFDIYIYIFIYICIYIYITHTWSFFCSMMFGLEKRPFSLAWTRSWPRPELRQLRDWHLPLLMPHVNKPIVA